MEVCGTRGALCGGRARGGEGECPEWPLYPSQANSRKLSRILCCPYSCFEIVKMTKIEKSHFTKKIIRTTADSVLFPSAVRGLKVSLLRADVAPPRRCLGGQVEAKMLQNLVLKSMSLLRGLVPLPT